MFNCKCIHTVVKMSLSVSFSFQEKLAMLWFFIDGFTHLTIEAGYLWLALTTTGKL